MSALQCITPPALEPVSLIEAKAQLRVDGAQDDALISSLITVARQAAEAWLNRALITQTWRLQCDAAPADVLKLPRAPLQAVVHVKVYDSTDQAGVLAAGLYHVDTLSAPGRIWCAETWPQPGRAYGGFEVQYTAGYGSAASDVPMALRQGLLAHIAHLYANRGDEAGAAIPAAALALYAPYRIHPGVA